MSPPKKQRWHGEQRRIPSSRNGACPRTGKALYRTKRKANRAKDRLNEALMKIGEPAAVTYVYHCGLCDGWHFTSREPGTGEAAERILAELETPDRDSR